MITVQKTELTKCRIKAGYSQRGLAEKIGMSGAYISQLESGGRNPSPETAKRLAEALCMAFNDLFTINIEIKYSA